MKVLDKVRRKVNKALRRIGSSNERQLYPADYSYREDPLPRPLSNVSLGEVFGWFFHAKEFLPTNPHVNEVAKKCRTDPAYSGDGPERVGWSAERETGHAIYAVLRLLLPKNVIEIGSYNGASSICIAQALHDNANGGHLHCVELDDYNIALTEQHLKEAGLNHLVSLHHGSSHDAALANSLPQSEFVFIDGDHTYDGARRDFELYTGRLSPRGMLLYHDTTKIMALRRLMQEIEKSMDFDVFTVATNDGDGMTFLRRRW
jgi:predicted O-methyltransferase YrrM